MENEPVLCAALLPGGNNGYDSSQGFIINRIKFCLVIDSEKIHFFLRGYYIRDNAGTATFALPFTFDRNPYFVGIIP